jgi:Ca2+/Na+ antiporter
MKKSVLNKFEEVYLTIFKFVIIVVLSIALIVSGVMFVKGLSDMNVKPGISSFARKAPKPDVNIDKFLNEVDPKEQTAPAVPIQENKTQIPRDTSSDVMADKYLANLWLYVNSYQKQCSVANPVNKDDFMNAFPKYDFKNLFSAYGEEFAESQDKFEKAVLSNKRIIQLCIDKKGQTQIIAASLGWHEKEYRKQLQEGKIFDEQELKRVKSEEENDYTKVAAKKAQGTQSLIVALGAFGVFIALMLLLIFSKLESILRGVKIIEKE